MKLNRMILFSVATTLFISNAAPASSFTGWGIQGGPNYGKLDYHRPLWNVTNYFLDVKSKQGFTVAVFAEYEVAKNIVLQPSLRFVRIRSYEVHEYFEGMMYGNKTLEFLSIPFLAKLRIGRSPRMFVAAGPEVGFRTRGEWSFYTSEGYPSSQKRILSHLHTMNFAFDAGIGLEFDTGQRAILIEARYSLGINDLAPLLCADDYYAADKFKLSPRELAFTLGIKF